MRFPENELESLVAGKIPDPRYTVRDKTSEFLTYFMSTNTILFDYEGKTYRFKFVSSDSGGFIIIQPRFKDKTMEVSEFIEAVESPNDVPQEIQTPCGD